MSDEELMHYGVKGMRWGVRRAREGAESRRIGDSKKDLKDARKDTRWEEKRQSRGVGTGWLSKRNSAVAKKAVKDMKPELKTLNKSPEFRTLKARADIRKDRGYMTGRNPTSIAYKKAVSDLYMKHVRSAAATELKVSPSGKWKESFTETSNSWNVVLKRVDDVKHAAISDPDLDINVRPIEDEEGYIVDFELVEDSVAQSDAFSDDESLAHFGVKGMRWGVRRADRGGGDGGGGGVQMKSKRISRAENRQANAIARDKFRADKAKTLLDKAAKDGDNVLLHVQMQSDLGQSRVLTGTEFVDRLSRGDAFNVDFSEVYARKRSAEGPYEIGVDKAIGRYKKQNFRALEPKR